MPVYCRKRFVILTAVLLVSILLLLTSGTFARQDSEKIMMQTPARIHYTAFFKSIQLSAGGPRITTGDGWEIKEVETGLYQLKYAKWNNSFWEIDLGKRTMSVVKDGVFGRHSERKNSVPIDAEFDKKWIKKGAGSPFDIYIKKSIIIYDPKKKSLDVRIADMSVTRSDEWEGVKVAPGVYHLKHFSWKGVFWEINTSERKVIYVSSGNFGIYGVPGSEIPLMKVLTAKGDAAAVKETDKKSPNLDVVTDLGFNSSAPARVSEWTDSEKRLYASILIKGAYDVLVAPFQVQGYAFDRANRSLMTKYLAHAIESRTDFKLPDPTLVDTAFGKGVRRISNDDIYRIANTIKARVLIRGYVGHRLDEKMFLTLLVQVRGGDGTLGQMTKVTRLDWRDVPFSDTMPPAEVFRRMLNDVMARLPVNLIRDPKPRYFESSNLPVPEGIGAMLQGKSSVIRDAYNLQLMGMLYPVDSRKDYVDDYYEREPLFERSLIALEGISPDSPDYRLLKARAWFYLRSRPAALKALGTPRTPKDKAFLGYLNGNIYEMEKWVDRIAAPIDKLIARIELNDIRADYSWDLYDREFVKSVSRSHKGLEVLLAKRLSGKEKRDIIPSAVIKKLMDEAFPVRGFDIATLLRGKSFTEGVPFDDYEIDLSIYRHRRRILESGINKFTNENGAARPVLLDNLELLYNVGEGNLWKKVRYLVFSEMSYGGAMRLLDIYEEVYRGHLKHLYLKKLVTTGLLGLKPGNRRYISEKSALEKKVCYYAQGQLRMAECRFLKYYDHDYPKHWSKIKASDRKILKNYIIRGVKNGPLGKKPAYLKSLEEDLLYSSNRLESLTRYYNALVNHGMRKEAKELIRLTEARFEGDPEKVYFLAGIAERNGDYAKEAAIYRQAVKKDPTIWSYYKGLGTYYLRMGKYQKANSVFKKYPMFMTDGRDLPEYSSLVYYVGVAFLNRGRVKEAEFFLKKSADNHADVYSEEWSRAYLAILEGDPSAAAAHFLKSYRRYNDILAFSNYVSLLHLTGRHDEATAVSSAVNYPGQIPTYALIGFRMEGVSENEQLSRLNDERFYKMSPFAAYNFTVMSMMDRAPENDTYKRVKSLRGAVSTRVSFIKTFGEGYYLIRRGLYAGAFSVLKNFKDKYIKVYFRPSYNDHGTLIPYYAYAAAKTGHAAEALKFLDEVKEKIGEDYQYHLSMAFINGIGNRHAEALKSLESARNAIVGLDTWPMPQWYKLVEAYEWLYAESGEEEYIRLAVNLAKTYQKIMPMWAWAFAVEAKYAKPGPARTRALAIALFLDKRSERISGIPERDKRKAWKWLEKNNPFLNASGPKGGV